MNVKLPIEATEVIKNLKGQLNVYNIQEAVNVLNGKLAKSLLEKQIIEISMELGVVAVFFEDPNDESYFSEIHLFPVMNKLLPVLQEGIGGRLNYEFTYGGFPVLSVDGNLYRFTEEECDKIFEYVQLRGHDNNIYQLLEHLGKTP